MKVGIIGAGAVGSIIARELSKIQNIDLRLMARSERKGFIIKHKGEEVFHPIEVKDISTINEQFDLIFIASKTTALANIKDKVTELMHEDTELVYALNGMGYDDMFSNSIPSVVYISGQQTKDYIEHFLNQRLIVEDKTYRYLDTLIQQLEVNKNITLTIEKSTDFKLMRYEKLLINVGVNSVTALSKNTAQIFKSQEMIELTKILLKESVDIVNHYNTDGLTIDESFIERAINTYLTYPDHMGTSMYYDVLDNRPIEVEYIQDYLVRLCEDDKKAPVLRTVTALLNGYNMTKS